MANEIKEALKEAVANAEADGQEGEVSARVKKLLARKTNLRRRTHNPNRPRRK